MPAQYGGRLVGGGRADEGRQQRGAARQRWYRPHCQPSGAGRPHCKGKGSFIVTGRRTYADVFLKLSKNETTRTSSLYFYDLNAKANYALNERNRLYLSAYLGRDALGLANTFGQYYGNQTATLRLNHLFSDRVFSNTSLIYSKYDYEIDILANALNFQILSKIQDLNLKQDFEFTPSTTQTLRFGAQAIYHTITPGYVVASDNSGVNGTADRTNYSLETAAYVSHEWQAAPRLNFTTGLRLSEFSLLGPGTYSTYDAQGDVLETPLTISPKQVISENLRPAGATLSGQLRTHRGQHPEGQLRPQRAEPAPAQQQQHRPAHRPLRAHHLQCAARGGRPGEPELLPQAGHR
ncbi:MAG: hypothetical protein WKG07_47155 [Hymenobacter sp.]